MTCLDASASRDPREGAGALLLPVVILLGFALVLTFIGTRVFNWDDV